MDPLLNMSLWSNEENAIMLLGHMEFGNKWSLLSHMLDGRTPNQVKNHWNSYVKKLLENCDYEEAVRNLVDTTNSQTVDDLFALYEEKRKVGLATPRLISRRRSLTTSSNASSDSLGNESESGSTHSPIYPSSSPLVHVKRDSMDTDQLNLLRHSLSVNPSQPFSETEYSSNGKQNYHSIPFVGGELLSFSLSFRPSLTLL